MGTKGKLLLFLLLSVEIFAFQTKTERLYNIRFHDMNSVNFERLKSDYGLTLEYCILDGLCAFSSLSELSKEAQEGIVKNEPNIKLFRIQKEFRMKPY